MMNEKLFEWVRKQPDRPFVILYGHLLVVTLYLTGRAVSPIPFNQSFTKTLVTSDLIPLLHLTAAAGMICALFFGGRLITVGAYMSMTIWLFTTLVLFQASNDRHPPLALWASALSSVITLASVLMLVRWGVDGDDSEVT